MRVRLLLVPSLLVAVACRPAEWESTDSSASRTNFVLILADDLGWADVGYQGSTFHRTPNLDALACAGLAFTQAYAAAPVCSPSRAAIVTGMAPARLHFTAVQEEAPLEALDVRLDRAEEGELVAPAVRVALPAEVPTIGSLLRAAGYRTGWIGKWHLGSGPLEHGFDLHLGGTGGGADGYFPPYGLPSLTDGPPGEYLTDRLTEEAVRFLEENRERPFLLVLAHYAPHLPLQAPPELVAGYEARLDPAGAQRNPIYAAMIERLDASVGRVRAALEDLGLAERTLLVFTSDNGALEKKRALRNGKEAWTAERPRPYHITSNRPLRSGKGHLYEGGVRVPWIAWGGPVGRARTCDVPVIGMDLLPTFLALAGLVPVPVCDGVDLGPLLAGADDLGRHSLYFHSPHDSFESAVRRGDEKLVYSWSREKSELFDLAADPGEQRDLAAERPSRTAELEAELFRWLDDVDAGRPVRAGSVPGR